MAYKEHSGKWHTRWLAVVDWREKHISEKSFLIILALLVGVTCGFAALLLKFLIHSISDTLTAHLSMTSANWPYLVLPMIGIIIVTLYVRYLVKDNISHGVTKDSVHRRGHRLQHRPGVPYVATCPHAPCGMRRGSRYSRHIPCPYRRYAFHPRGSDA